MSRFISIFLLLLPLVSRAQKPQTYYVAVKGKDSNPGTIEKPFATLLKARNTMRVQRKLHPCYQPSKKYPFKTLALKQSNKFNHFNQ